MAFVRARSGNKAALSRTGPGRVFRWLAVSGAGIGLASLSLAGVAGLVFLATSLTSPSGQTAMPDRLALATTLYSSPLRQGCAADCPQRTQYIVQQAKSPRATPAVDAHLKAPAAPTATQRFDKARAALSHDKLAAAIAHSRQQVAELAPVKDRFYPTSKASLARSSGPVPARFGPQVAEIERSSRLALALAGAGEIQVAYAPVATSTTVPSMPLMAMLDATGPVETTEIFEIVPDSAPLPARRPKPAPAAIAEAAPPPAAKPARRAAAQQPVLAYAAPGDDAPSVGQAFKNLFSSPNAGKGVAVYDISAQTVTMPNGQRLEAHSGIGHMADNPSYADRKMNGPTPPNTYRLVMRESRFHGVEAIRLLPVDGKNKYGRDGLLAHSYLLRGGRAESHGCVAFADYDRFLKAFKQGKITHMVVVPGRGRSAPRVASNGRRS